MTKLTTGQEFEIRGHSFKVAQFFEEPNNGLVNIEEDRDPSIFNFILPVDLVEALTQCVCCQGGARTVTAEQSAVLKEFEHDLLALAKEVLKLRNMK